MLRTKEQNLRMKEAPLTHRDWSEIKEELVKVTKALHTGRHRNKPLTKEERRSFEGQYATLCWVLDVPTDSTLFGG